jgi:Sigma-70, region 4
VGGDPAAIVTSQSSIRLALITALQYFPSRQRVVLIMRDVLGWRAAEVAELLGSTTFAVDRDYEYGRMSPSSRARSADLGELNLAHPHIGITCMSGSPGAGVRPDDGAPDRPPMGEPSVKRA